MSEHVLPAGFIKNPYFHAYLFVSGDFFSRRDTARLIAKSLLCRNRINGTMPCGKCDCCIKADAGSHPDCIFISGTEKTSVDDVRKIEDEAYLASNEADSKVFILEDADEYNVQSQNALLKIIEEPPQGVKFVLTASSLSGILPTVRSRVCVLSGNVRSFDNVKREIKSSKPHLVDDDVLTLSNFVVNYDKADIRTLDEVQIREYTQQAHLFLSGKDSNVIAAFPKKREELMLCLQVFMLACRQVAVIKATGALTEGILSAKHISECNAKTSSKRAHSLYDVFEKAYLLTESYANVNAVLSYLMQNAK